MQILNITMLLLALVVSDTTAQIHHYWIMFRNKNASSSFENNSQSLGITERALKRRAKSLPPDRLIDDLDFPISEAVLSQIRQTGVKIRTVSRWLNAVSVEASTKQLQILNALPIVSQSEPVVQFQRPLPLPLSMLPPSLVKSSGVQGLNYGPSATQLTNMKAVDLHAIGVNGTGVLIGMLDDGFNNYRTHTALKNIKVIATHDFIHNIDDVSIQPWEYTTSPGQGDHGAGTLSALGGFDNGHMIGAAFGASFILAKTEMDSSGNGADFNSEEDTYVAGLEWAERLGADITSSSLGYKQFEDSLFAPLPYYTTSDMNGRTTKVAVAAVIAARKGVLVVTAMGNDGSISGKGNQSQRANTTLDSPADADSIVSVGATSSDGELAVFSGCGPTADGRLKPEIVAQGMGVYWADGSTTTDYTIVSGTSCSTPLVAGAAALILSAHPQLTNMQVRDALMKTTVQRKDGTSETAVYPNNYYGNGFVDAYSAALSLGPVFSNAPVVTLLDSQLIVSTFVVSKSRILIDSLFLYYSLDGSAFNRVHLQSTSTQNEHSVIISFPSNADSVFGYFSVYDSSGLNYRYPPTNTFRYPIKQNTTQPQKYAVLQNYPNPFSFTSGTILKFESPDEGEVEVAIFNILGQRVKTIFHGPALLGTNLISYDGTDGSGRHIASGVYFARLKSQNSIRSIKMLYLK
jgi:subtilisin family serine protease